ncbi:MAG TPA: glucokinase [Gemmatimonadales bacterium]|jgi:glucokinase
MIVLAGDVGGTNARLALVELDGATTHVQREEHYPSHDYPGLGPIVTKFLAGGAKPGRACFGIAGPVVNGETHVSNLPWVVNAQALGAEVGIAKTALINDFLAVGYGIERLAPGDLVTLQQGRRVADGPIALIGAGTGLGEGMLVWDDGKYRVHASEGGHADFAPRDAGEIGLLLHLQRTFGHVSYERVLSGHGLVECYKFLAEARVGREHPDIKAEMAKEDPAAVITRHAMEGSDALSRKALDLFCSVYGAEAGNMALRLMATGGVYLAGGIAPRIVHRLDAGGFMAAFRAKGRLSEFVEQVPVHVIMNAKVGLLGAAAVAARL